mmetsp:Transcript_5140/g.14474  ORF Transcript_5140/g.14474 Transcript_5140/m.14474 type:complete len:99 (+) Transcript_5140:459-755(+)
MARNLARQEKSKKAKFSQYQKAFSPILAKEQDTCSRPMTECSLEEYAKAQSSIPRSPDWTGALPVAAVVVVAAAAVPTNKTRRIIIVFLDQPQNGTRL